MYARSLKTSDAPAIHVSARDLERLRALVEQHAGGRDAAAAEQLEAELERAVVLPADAVPRDLVTMHARALFEDGTGKRREVELVYPWEADPSRGRVSVLAPVGAALLGLSVGQRIDWPLPGGRTAALTIVQVMPEH
jgi:regulator of nucleoside diphosphate kinase